MHDDRINEMPRLLAARGVDRRSLLRLTGAGAGAAMLAAMPGRAMRGLAAPALQDAQLGGTLIYARDGDADSLDPQKTTTTLSWQVQGQIYESLTAFDAEGNIVPNLAKSWEISDDGKEYTFTLQEGVTFHDGTPVNAEAVKFTFDRFMAEETSNPSKASIGPLTGTEVVDDLTVRMTFEAPFAPLLSFLTDPFAGIISPAAVEAAGDDFGNAPVGSGPFKFNEWSRAITSCSTASRSTGASTRCTATRDLPTWSR